MSSSEAKELWMFSFSDPCYHLPSLCCSWDAPRLHLSAPSVCIPVELYLKAPSLHWLQECTSAVRPPSHCLPPTPSAHVHNHLFLIGEVAFTTASKLQSQHNINIQEEREGCLSQQQVLLPREALRLFRRYKQNSHGWKRQITNTDINYFQICNVIHSFVAYS